MRPLIRKANATFEFEIPEGCFIQEMTTALEDPHLSIARARVPVGATTEWHALRGIEERYLLVSGRGRVEVAGLAPAEVEPGDVVLIPPGTPQRITNIGEGDLVFQCVCTPRFRADCYETLPEQR